MRPRALRAALIATVHGACGPSLVPAAIESDGADVGADPFGSATSTGPPGPSEPSAGDATRGGDSSGGACAAPADAGAWHACDLPIAGELFTLVDLDDDGIRDLVVAESACPDCAPPSGARLSWHAGDGAAGFAPPMELAGLDDHEPGRWVRMIRLGGGLDQLHRILVVREVDRGASTGTDAVLIRELGVERDHDGVFDGVDPPSLRAIDIDDDGVLDLIQSGDPVRTWTTEFLGWFDPGEQALGEIGDGLEVRAGSFDLQAFRRETIADGEASPRLQVRGATAAGADGSTFTPLPPIDTWPVLAWAADRFRLVGLVGAGDVVGLRPDETHARDILVVYVEAYRGPVIHELALPGAALAFDVVRQTHDVNVVAVRLRSPHAIVVYAFTGAAEPALVDQLPLSGMPLADGVPALLEAVDLDGDEIVDFVTNVATPTSASRVTVLFSAR